MDVGRVLNTKAAVPRYSSKKGFLKILHYSQENTCVEVSFNKTNFRIHRNLNECLKACNFIKKRHQHRCFPVNLAKFFVTLFLIEDLRGTASVSERLWIPGILVFLNFHVFFGQIKHEICFLFGLYLTPEHTDKWSHLEKQLRQYKWILCNELGLGVSLWKLSRVSSKFTEVRRQGCYSGVFIVNFE